MIRIVLCLMLLVSACGDSAVTASELRERWGEPCTVSPEGPNVETWTYCVTVKGETEFTAKCAPGCEPAHQMRIVDGIIVADMPAEVTP